MAEEKRVQLGVDIGELSNQLVQINNFVEQNYQKALQGQAAYNKIIEESISLLERQSELVQGIGDSLQNSIFNQGSMPIMGSGTVGGGQDKQNNLEDIEENIENIWEFLSELGNPIPVEVRNTPLQVKVVEGSNEGEGTAEGGQNRNGENKNQQNGSQVSVSRGFNTIAGTVSDPNYLLAAVAGMVPYIGMGLSSVLSKVIQEGEQLLSGQAIFRGATGGNYSFQSLVGIGLKDADALRKEAEYYRSNIRLSLSDLQFEKGYGVSGGTMDSLLRAMREDVIAKTYNISSSELGVTYLSSLGTRIKDPVQVRGYTEEYLKVLIDLNQQQLETTGETNSLINSEVIQGIAQVSEKFGDPTVLSRVVSSIRGGLTQAATPQLEALQYYALSQSNPEADLWKMQLMRENPFSEESRGYFGNYLSSLLQTGNETDVRFNVMNAFGLTAHQTEELLNGIQKAKNKLGKEFDLIDYLEGIDLTGITESNFSFSTNAGSIIRSEASAATSNVEVMLADIANHLARTGIPLLEVTNKAYGKVEEAIETVSDWMENGIVGSITNGITNWWNNTFGGGGTPNNPSPQIPQP